LFATAGAEAVLVPCLMLWALLYTLGLLNEGRGYATKFELLRLLVVVPAGGVALLLDSRIGVAPEVVAAASGVYIATSLGTLILASRTRKQFIINEI
jgi:hypothetical protein